MGNHHPHHPHMGGHPGFPGPHHLLQQRSSTPIQQPGLANPHPLNPAAGLPISSPTVGGPNNHLLAPVLHNNNDDNNSMTADDAEEEAPSPVGSGPPRGPSPEPRIEDSECHRSQSAM